MQVIVLMFLWCFRATGIMYLRRAGMEWQSIARVTGHTSVDSLIKHYDLRIEVSWKGVNLDGRGIFMSFCRVVSWPTSPPS